MNQPGIVVAVIPARGGSKGLPGKNILLLGGKPVLAHTIGAALDAGCLDHIVLSTDSEEIARIGQEFGVEAPFLRPAHLATDTAHTPPVIEHAVGFLEEREGFEAALVVTLQPTSPLRLPEHIAQTVSLMQTHPEMDSAITVSEVGIPPFWMFRLSGDLLHPFINDGIDYSLKERQELDPVYRPNGAVYVTRRQLLRKKGVIFSAFSGGNTGYVCMDPISSLDIDNMTDFMVIEAALKARSQRE